MEHIFIPSYQDMHCSNSWNTLDWSCSEKSRKASAKTIISQNLSSLKLFSLLFFFEQ